MTEGHAIRGQAGLFGGRIILDQNWALEAIYAIFNREKILPLLRGYGRFSRVFFSDLTCEPLQYLIRSHFTFHL
jgi:hypothetical protein